MTLDANTISLVKRGFFKHNSIKQMARLYYQKLLCEGSSCEKAKIIVGEDFGISRATLCNWIKPPKKSKK